MVGDPGDLFQSRKMRVLHFKDSFLKLFQFFLELFVTIHFLSTESLPNPWCHSLQPPLLHLFTSKSSRKRYGLLFSHLISCILNFIFVSICVGVLIVVIGLFRCFFWIVLVWIIKGIFPIQTCFGWWCHIFSSVCFSWDNLIACFVIDVLSHVGFFYPFCLNLILVGLLCSLIFHLWWIWFDVSDSYVINVAHD